LLNCTENEADEHSSDSGTSRGQGSKTTIEEFSHD